MDQQLLERKRQSHSGSKGPSKKSSQPHPKDGPKCPFTRLLMGRLKHLAKKEHGRVHGEG